MNFVQQAVDELARLKRWGYKDGGPSFTEPAALSALALWGHGRPDEAQAALDWLAEVQAADGSLGLNAEQLEPRWPTAPAALAWLTADDPAHARRALVWLHRAEGKPLPPSENIGHDTTLVGWPWVEGTHSWVEPTAWALLALRRSGHGDAPRARAAERLLVDRLLPTGGCNYGNTVVLGRTLRPHLQPSGLVLAALAPAHGSNPRVTATIEYILDSLTPETPAASLSYALMGLAAHGASPGEHDAWLDVAAERVIRRERSPLKLALVALAALGEAGPLLNLPNKEPT